MEKETDEDLIQRIQQDPAQFGILFDAHYPAIFNYILRRVGHYSAGKDIASETFLKAFLNIHKFKWKGVPALYWLYRIASNEIRQYFRKEKYVPDSIFLIIETAGWDIADEADCPEKIAYQEAELKRDEEFEKVRQALKKLNMIYQEALALRYFEQKSVKEIAVILDKKEGTVKSLLSRGIEKLRKLL